MLLIPISSVFALDIVTSLKSIVESAKIETMPGMFMDEKNQEMSYTEFLSKLEFGFWGYSVRRDENNRIVMISLVPKSTKVAEPAKEPAVGDPVPIINVVSEDGRDFSSTNLRG